MSIINTIKNILALNDDITEKRIGLSSFKPMTKTIENATAHIPSIRTSEIKLSDLMRRTNIY